MGVATIDPRIIERVVDAAPIPLDDVDLRLRDAARVRRALGLTFSYFARVEGEVAADPLLALLPRLGTTYRGYESQGRRFLPAWVAQEQAHGRIFDELQRALGLTPSPIRTGVPWHNKLVGVINGLSPALHAVFEMVYLSRGAMHEKLTAIGYAQMARIVRDLEEHELHRTAIEPIGRQEATHLAYYTTEARRLRGHLEPWQLRLARRISVLTYAPVGAGSPRHEAHFGHVARALAGDQVEILSAPVRGIARKLLGPDEGDGMPDFVTGALRTCLAAAAR